MNNFSVVCCYIANCVCNDIWYLGRGRGFWPCRGRGQVWILFANWKPCI